jgi:hypothetical protein
MAYQLKSFISGPVLLRTGRSNISLPPEIVAYVWSFLTWKDLVKFGRTSRANYRLVRGALRNTVHRLVAPFTLKGGVDRFMGMLRSERAVISGSMALFPLMFCNFSGTNSNGSYWSPRDMDIYEPKRGKDGSGVLKYLLEIEGYEEHNVRERSLREQYDALRGIRQVKKVGRDGICVDIVTSSSSSAISPIFHFHSTPVINWISPEGLFSAYPNLTCARRGLLNPMALDRTRFVPALPGTDVRHSLDKYNIRGFDIRRNPSCWPDDTHPCTFSAQCPIASRNVVDGGCMFVPFTEDFVGGLGETSKVLPYDSPYICFWYLGGPSCDGRRRVSDSYVSLRADANDERFMR